MTKLPQDGISTCQNASEWKSVCDSVYMVQCAKVG